MIVSKKWSLILLEVEIRGTSEQRGGGTFRDVPGKIRPINLGKSGRRPTPAIEDLSVLHETDAPVRLDEGGDDE